MANMSKMVMVLFLATLVPTDVHAESRWARVWKWSQAALVAASVADVASSYGHMEANPLLRSTGGRFRARGLTIKMGVVGGILAAQHLQVKLRGRDRAPYGIMAVANITASAATATVAVRNWRLP